MNRAILKRLAFGKASVYLTLMLLNLAVATVGTGRAAQAATNGDPHTGSASTSPLARVQAAAFSSCSNVSEIPLAECEALVALFNSTDGPNWTVNSGWLETDTPCSWHGVTCTAGNVVRLGLDSNGLNGSIPAELGNVSSLTQLHLDHNELSGTMPAELGNLSSLQGLFLRFNQLSGSIPLELGNLSILTSLSLFTNELSGSIPAELPLRWPILGID